ncbi:hypothetical protein ACFWAR_35570 [Streptomyces sp. NPDC059917]|uniref:hypothetical protein n=1 Tax=Streptomyces sp. NPDC059917 TaxID=3347002 RepID=UPI003662E0F7
MRSTRRSPRRTTLRAAAVTAGAVAVLALPVGAAFADSPASPDAAVLPGVEQPVTDPTPDKPVTDPTPDKPVTPTPDKDGKPRPDGNVRAFVTTVKLADGSVAKVYKIGDRHFEADVFAGSTKLATLVSKDGKAAYGQHNGMHVALQPNGTVTSWIEGQDDKKEDKKEDKKDDRKKDEKEVRKESSVRITMPDGRIAKLIDGPNGKRVELFTANGNFLGSIDLKNPGEVNDGWTYKLVRDGHRVKFVVIDGKHGGSSWVYDFGGKLIEKYTAEQKQEKQQKPQKHDKPQVASDRVVPKGGVKAGAEGVTSQADAGGPALVAAGGGMAAIGAAGLGFAMFRRNRADRQH